MNKTILTIKDKKVIKIEPNKIMEHKKVNSVEDLKGFTMESVKNINDEELVFKTKCGRTFKLYHSQDCCESVVIDDIVGDLKDLEGVPLLQSEEVDNDCNENPGGDSYTWTFYKFATIKGYVTVKWYGSSNGYYSESVDFCEIK